MDEARKTGSAANVTGKLAFHIAENRARRCVANVGASAASFVACWPSDAGHDYDLIREQGFGARLLNL